MPASSSSQSLGLIPVPNMIHNQSSGLANFPFIRQGVANMAPTGELEVDEFEQFDNSDSLDG